MRNSVGQSETSERRQTMLCSAFRGAAAAALDADDVIEVLANPDGSVWIERAGIGLVHEAETLDAEARERIIRLVANSVGEVCDRTNPVISAELPGSGERFEGLLPPVPEAPCFAIRKFASLPEIVNFDVTRRLSRPVPAEFDKYERKNPDLRNL